MRVIEFSLLLVFVLACRLEAEGIHELRSMRAFKPTNNRTAGAWVWSASRTHELPINDEARQSIVDSLFARTINSREVNETVSEVIDEKQLVRWKQIVAQHLLAYGEFLTACEVLGIELTESQSQKLLEVRPDLNERVQLGEAKVTIACEIFQPAMNSAAFQRTFGKIFVPVGTQLSFPRQFLSDCGLLRVASTPQVQAECRMTPNQVQRLSQMRARYIKRGWLAPEDGLIVPLFPGVSIEETRRTSRLDVAGVVDRRQLGRLTQVYNQYMCRKLGNPEEVVGILNLNPTKRELIEIKRRSDLFQLEISNYEVLFATKYCDRKFADILGEGRILAAVGKPAVFPPLGKTKLELFSSPVLQLMEERGQETKSRRSRRQAG